MISKNILVTGGCGFIGSHLCKRLIREGHSVIALDNLQSGRYANVISLRDHERFLFYKLDIRDTSDKIRGLFKWADIVYNQAASKKNICLNDPKQDLEINGWGTLNLLKLAVKYDIEKFIHASTGSVYGEVEGLTTEETPFNPCSYYGVSKLAGERYVNVYNKRYGLNTTILRYFHVYGKYQSAKDDLGGVCAIFARRIADKQPVIINGTGEQIRSFTHIDNVVEANIKSLTMGDGEIYNVASGVQITVKELAIKLAKHLRRKLKVEHTDWLEGDIMDFNIDNTKIMNDFGMEFKKELDFSWLK